jgi:hypothetical protein
MALTDSISEINHHSQTGTLRTVLPGNQVRGVLSPIGHYSCPPSRHGIVNAIPAHSENCPRFPGITRFSIPVHIRKLSHLYFAKTAQFCELCDQNSFDPDYPTLPLAAFETIVRRFFSGPRP